MRSSFFLAVAAALTACIVSTTAATINDPELGWYPVVRKDIDQAIEDALEKLRAEMTSGDASLGIPPLEPLSVSRLDFNINEDIAVAKGYLRNLTITHLSEFQIITVKNDLANLKAYFKLSFPTIHFAGHYNVSGRVVNALNIYGDGDFWLTLTNLTTWGNVALSSKDGSEDSAVIIDTLDIDFTLVDLKANFQNLNGGGSDGDALNAIINENGAALVSQEKQPVASFIDKTVVSFANQRLSRFTLRQVLRYLGVEN